MMLEDCIRIAKKAGALILDLSKKPRQIEKKQAFDLVTDADKAANDLIVQRLQEAYPEHLILAEESPPPQPSPGGRGRITWIVDPIDGTTNYARGIPHAAVSIAAYDIDKKELLVGCVYDPFKNECFWAEKNKGAFLNGAPIRVSEVAELKDAVVATGFFNNGNLSYETSNLPQAYEFIRRSLGFRRNGAASLDLAWVAMGRLDVYWERGLKAWDLAAGVLIVQEAGGQVSNYPQEGFDLFDGSVVSTNRLLHPETLLTLNNI
jgi:myo-inositol-1(or 4)-monophosphatase